MKNNKKLALAVTMTMLISNPLYGCGSPQYKDSLNKVQQEEEEKEENSNVTGSGGSAHGGGYFPFFRSSKNSSIKSKSGSSGNSFWSTSHSSKGYSNSHGGSISG